MAGPLLTPHPTPPHTHTLGCLYAMADSFWLSDGWALASLDFVGARLWLATPHWLVGWWSCWKGQVPRKFFRYNIGTLHIGPNSWVHFAPPGDSGSRTALQTDQRCLGTDLTVRQQGCVTIVAALPSHGLTLTMTKDPPTILQRVVGVLEDIIVRELCWQYQLWLLVAR